VSELVRAAGGLVVRHGGEGLQVLLVHRPAYDDWSFPKGKLEVGELEPDAALREVEEETGLRCLLGRELGRTEYVDSSGRPKHARYWTMVAPAGEARPANEVDDLAWAGPAAAADRLSYEHDRALLARLGDAAGGESELVFLVRHAKAGNREKWEAPDELRPLSGPGRRQAQALVALFADARIAALVSSPYVRCVETLSPLATAAGLPVQEHGALAEGAPVSAALELARAVGALGPVALSTHGDVQQVAVQSLAAAGVPLDGRLDFQKGSTWILEVRRGEVIAGRYVPPPA
jgi:8-oxo-dGTP pyrophosphatase MutT (NUDIX family)/phosphohistidine phosphatase SixA